MTRSRPPALRYELDARVELLAALVMTARPAEHAARFKAESPYADAVRAHFAALKKHAAVAALKKSVPEHLITELILLQPDARRLEIDSTTSGGLLTQAGGAGEMAALFDALRDAGKRSGYEAFFKTKTKEHDAFIALAKAESAKSLAPEAVADYLRMPFAGSYRLILSPLLPMAFAANVVRNGEEIRVRAGVADEGRLTFEYDVFDSCAAHELTHTLLTPLIEGSRKAFESMPGKPPKTCRDAGSWSGCVEEHLVRAVTLRVLKLDGKDKEYAAILNRYARDGYPYLKDVCARLESFEAGDAPFAAFYPGLLSVFA